MNKKMKSLIASSAILLDPAHAADTTRPNIVFIFSDDHALNAISAYGGRLAKVAPTPNIDRLAREGAIFHNSFCANSLCGPSRACILTGKHSHVNGFYRNGAKPLDQSQWTIPKALHKGGYTTAIIGKWHLKSNPVGYDYWEVFPGQGNYYNPVFIEMDGKRKKVHGYASDLITKKTIAWLDRRDKSKPFFLMCQHKAPHRTWAPPLRYLNAFDGVHIPEPSTLFDDYANRSKTLARHKMGVASHFSWTYDLALRKDELHGVKLPGNFHYGPKEYRRMDKEQKRVWNAHFSPLNQKFLQNFKAGKYSKKDIVIWRYQRYMRMYLAAVKAVDESVGTLLKYLDDNGLSKNTVVIYSSDQGFYLGEHGWFDKRWMFEESLHMPFLIRWPGVIKPGSKPKAMIQNIDYAPTFLEMAGLPIPQDIQGKSIVPILKDSSKIVRKSIYYAYYEAGGHGVPKHFGVRTEKYKLFYLPATKEWQMFNLEKDKHEMKNVYDNPEYASIRESLIAEYNRLRKLYKAPDYGAKRKSRRKKVNH